MKRKPLHKQCTPTKCVQSTADENQSSGKLSIKIKKRFC